MSYHDACSKRLSFELEPKGKTEQSSSAESLAQWSISNLSHLDALVALQQIEKILYLARHIIQKEALASLSHGDHHAFGAKVRVLEVVDRPQIPELAQLLKERKVQIYEIQKRFNDQIKEILSQITNPPKKKQIAIYFQKNIATKPSKSEESDCEDIVVWDEISEFETPESQATGITCDYCGRIRASDQIFQAKYGFYCSLECQMDAEDY